MIGAKWLNKKLAGKISDEEKQERTVWPESYALTKFAEKYQKGRKGYLPYQIDLTDFSNTSSNSPFFFTAHGCAGTLAQEQRDIAANLKSSDVAGGRRDGDFYLEHILNRSAFNFILGDNVYSNGAENDDDIKKFYHKFYGDLSSFCVLGNHDYGYWGYANISAANNGREGNRGVLNARVQVDFTYSAQNRITNEATYHSWLPVWNMPNRYYLLSHDYVDFIALDSNVFLWDKEQQTWLKDIWKIIKDNGKRKVIVQHHPFVTFGKRFGHLSDDSDLKVYTTYMSPDLIQAQRAIKSEGHIGNVIETWFENNEITFDLLLCAHDHSLEVTRLKNGAVQIISGSGGVSRAENKPLPPIRLKRALSWGEGLNEMIAKINGFPVITVQNNRLSFIIYGGKKGSNWFQVGPEFNVPLKGRERIIEIQDIVLSGARSLIRYIENNNIWKGKARLKKGSIPDGVELMRKLIKENLETFDQLDQYAARFNQPTPVAITRTEFEGLLGSGSGSGLGFFFNEIERIANERLDKSSLSSRFLRSEETTIFYQSVKDEASSLGMLYGQRDDHPTS